MGIYSHSVQVTCSVCGRVHKMDPVAFSRDLFPLDSIVCVRVTTSHTSEERYYVCANPSMEPFTIHSKCLGELHEALAKQELQYLRNPGV
jgi:hypothetical protein